MTSDGQSNCVRPAPLHTLDFAFFLCQPFGSGSIESFMLRLRFLPGLILGLLIGVPGGIAIGLLVLPRGVEPNAGTSPLVQDLTRKLEAAKEARERADRQLEQFQKLAEQMTVSFNNLETRFKSLEEQQRVHAAQPSPPPAPAPRAAAPAPAAPAPAVPTATASVPSPPAAEAQDPHNAAAAAESDAPAHPDPTAPGSLSDLTAGSDPTESGAAGPTPTTGPGAGDQPAQPQLQ